MEDTTVRQVHLRGALGQIRTGTYNGAKHLVVPVTALMEGVIHAINADHPEYVPLKSLSIAPQGWNGRPVMMGHPAKFGRQISANDPEVLESSGFGQIFKTRLENNRLLMEAWVDPERAKKVGGEEFLKRLESGDPIEVSVGAYVTTEPKVGSHNGKAYKAVWREIVPDHLAFLPNGVGACSIEMGCGTNRSAAVHLVTAEGMEVVEISDLGGPGSGPQKGGAEKSKEAFKKTTKATKSGEVKDNLAAAKAHREAADAHRADGNEMKAAEHEGFASRHEAQAKEGPSGGVKDDNARWRKSKEERASNYQKMHGKHLEENESRSLRERVLFLMFPKALGSMYDTPSQAQSEEDAELIGYEAIRALLDQINSSYKEASSIVDDLIASETEDATESPEEEAAETEIEAARIDAINTFCMAMYSSLSAILSKTQKSYPTVYAAAKDCEMCKGTGSLDGNPCEACDGNGSIKTAAGKRNSASDLEVIQGVHDHSVALGASCASDNIKLMQGNVELILPSGRELAEAIVPELKAACACQGEKSMRNDVIKGLIANPSSGFTAADEKMLEAATDERLNEFKAASDKKVADLKAASDKEAADKAEADRLKFLAANQPKELTTEDVVKLLPPEMKSLIARAQKQEADRKVELVGKLKTAQDAYTEDELSALTLETLEKFAKVAKVDDEPVNYSGRAVPRSAAQSDDVFSNPPDPYAEGLKALREKNATRIQ